MNRKITLSAVLLAASVTACAPVTIETIRGDEAAKYLFQVNRDYKAVYSQILTQARRCYLEAPTRTQLILSDKHSNAEQAGYIALKHVYGKTQEHTHWLADIKAINESKTIVKAWYSKSPGSKKQAALIKKWVLGNSDSCKA